MWEAHSAAAILHLFGIPTRHRGTECPSHILSEVEFGLFHVVTIGLITLLVIGSMLDVQR
jgi:hypothetical protein